MEKSNEKSIEKEIPKAEELPLEETMEAEEKEEAKQEDALLLELQQKIDELNDLLLRQRAEFDNFRKRTQKEKEEIGLTARIQCISDWLPTLDNFERAMQAECADAEFKKGMEMIFHNFQDAFAKMGVAEIEAEGKPFDPALHYAVSTVENEEMEPNTVAAVLQKGYRMGDKVIRHVMVTVANP